MRRIFSLPFFRRSARMEAAVGIRKPPASRNGSSLAANHMAHEFEPTISKRYELPKLNQLVELRAERRNCRKGGSVAQNWDPQAYGREGSFVHKLAGGVLEWLNAQPGERILDLGCGDGQLTIRLKETGADVKGVDASSAMVEAARARGVDAQQAQAEKLP